MLREYFKIERKKPNLLKAVYNILKSNDKHQSHFGDHKSTNGREKSRKKICNLSVKSLDLDLS